MVRDRKLGFGRLLVAAAVVVAWTAGTPGLARGDEGGVKDSSGLVWSDTVVGPCSWLQATQAASDYAIIDGGVLYSDWRLPTRDELEHAWLDGTIPALVDARNNLDGVYWSSDLYARTKSKRTRWAYYFYWAHQGNGTGGPLYYGFDIASVDWPNGSAFFVRGR